MDQIENPITKERQSYWKKKITERFPQIDFSDGNFLSLIDYIDGYPQKFYSGKAFEIYLDILSELKISNRQLLKQFIDENQNSINRAIKTYDILAGIVESHGKYRIAWNKNWETGN